MSDIIKGAFGHDFSQLASVLKARKTRYVYFPNPGNAGDALIAANTFHAFRTLGISFEFGRSGGTYPGRDVIYAGGGNLIPGDNKPSRLFIERNKDLVRSLTLLPHSVHGHEDLLATLDDRVTLFGREATTLAYLKAAAPNARVLFCHDMAFFAKPAQLVEPFATSIMRETLRDWRHPGLLRYHLSTYRTWRRTVVGRDPECASGPEPDARVLNAFRTDEEKTEIILPPDNIDLSEHFTCYGHLRPPMVSAIVRAMSKAIAPFPVVRTNRLHVAILATLMGKSVEISDNSYGKLSAVYNASMHQQFPDIQFLSPKVIPDDSMEG